MQDSNSPLQALAAIIADHQPASILLCAAAPSSVIAKEINQHVASVLTIDKDQALLLEIPQQRFDLIIIADLLEQMTKIEGIQLLGRLKNAHGNTVCLFYNEQEAKEPWGPADFYSLGLHNAGQFTSKKSNVLLYTYDITAYNHT